jgi:hypothetical protein
VKSANIRIKNLFFKKVAIDVRKQQQSRSFSPITAQALTARLSLFAMLQAVVS